MQSKMVQFPDGRAVGALGLGSWHLGQGRRPAAAEVAALERGHALGMTLVDTAEMYGDGAAERLIAVSLKADRDSWFVVSKVYPHRAGRKSLAQACEQSLQRLGIACLDLYLLHWRAGTDLAEVVDGLEQLKAAGKIRAWGVSNFDVDDMEDLFRVPNGSHCATNQVLYNLSSRGIEHDLLPWCAERKMPVMAYSP